MSTLNHLNRKTKIIASIAIFTALYAALRIIPTVPMVGTGAAFRLSDILAPLYGILLGPLIGGLSILIGTFVAMIFMPSAPFLGLDFLPAFTVAVSLGLLVRGKWLPVVIINALLLVLYAINPLTSNFILTPWGPFPYLWMHIIAFIVLISPLGRKAGKWVREVKPVEKIPRPKGYLIKMALAVAFLIIGIILVLVAFSLPGEFTISSSKIAYAVIGFVSLIIPAIFIVKKLKIAKLTLGFIILAFIGTMMQHLTGGILYEVILGQITEAIPASAYPATWTVVFYVYPWERLALIIGSVLIGVPIVRTLSRTLFPPETTVNSK